MMWKPIALGAVLALGALSLPVTAQIARTDLADSSPPAEFPPASFSGRQYVDSRGCVYVRAGQAGTSIWVPRVAANKKVLCGFRPTLTRTAASEAPVVPDPRTRVAAAPTAAAAPARVAAPSSVVTPQPRRVAVAAPRQVARAGRYVPPRVTHNLSPAPYRAVATTPRSVATQPSGRAPQKVSVAPATTRVPASTAGSRALAGNLPPGTVIAVPSAAPVTIPPGYKRAWDDDRLNPYAGKQTLTGALQQALVWTQTVPRRLKTADGRDVTSQYNYLVYPYTDYAKQRAALGSGRYVVVQTTAGREVRPGVATRAAPQATTRISSKSQSVGGARYVQAGSFRDPANVQRSVARLQAAGLPVRIQRSGGLQTVLAGPLSGAQVNGALGAVRRAGFSDAFVR